MESPNLNAVDASSWNVTLPTGRTISLSDVTYDPDTNQWFYYGAPVTTLTRAQRLAFPSYDVARDNAAISDALRGPSGGSTNTLGLFVDGVSEDVKGIASKIRDFFAGDPNKPEAPSDIRKLVYVAIFAGVLYLVWKIVAAVKAK